MPIEPGQNDRLLRQRRFLLALSFALVAYSALCVSPGGEAEYSGLKLRVLRPEAAIWLIVAAWLWSAVTYAQRAYEVLSEIWKEVRQDVEAEEIRIALKWAARDVGRKFAAGGIAEPHQKNCRLSCPMDFEAVAEEPRLESDGRRTSTRVPSRPDASGGRIYDRYSGVYSYVSDTGPGVTTFNYSLEITHSQYRRIRVWAWINGVFEPPWLLRRLFVESHAAKATDSCC